MIFGLALLGFSLSVMAIALFRPDWLQRPGWSWLMRWGRGGVSFPASRVGALASSGLGLGFSLALLGTHFGVLSREVGAALILVPLVLCVPAAIYDFRLHRRRSRERAARRAPAARRLPVARMGVPELYAALRNGGAGESDVEAALRRRAARDPEAFAAFLRTVEFDEDCALSEVYLTLADEPDKHVELLLAEFDRLFSVAEQNPNNRWVFDQLTAYEFIDGPDQLVRGIVARILEALQSPVPQVRRCAACVAAGFVSTSAPDLDARLREIHSRDADWRVRALAYQSLGYSQDADRPASPLPTRALGDRVRWLFAGASVRDFSA